MVRQLTFLAHAKTSAQRQTRFSAANDTIEPLTNGEATAVLAELGDVHVVLGGPELRVAETARALGLEIDARDELAAWSSGAWAGRPMSEVTTDDPAAFEAWRIDPGAGAPGGESLLALLQRGARWLDEFASEDRLIVIADNSVIRAMAIHVLEASPESFWRMDVLPLSMTVLRGDGSRWRLRSLGAT